MLYIENVAGGANQEFPKCRGGERLYNVLTFQKFRRDNSSLLLLLLLLFITIIIIIIIIFSAKI